MAANIRIQPKTYQTLREIAERDRETLGETLSKAVEAYRRQKLLDETNRAYAALSNDPKA